MTLQPALWLWLPLLLAVGAAFVRQQIAALALLGCTLAGAALAGRMEAIALVSTLVVLGVAYRLPALAESERFKPLFFAGWAVVLVWCVMVSVHLVPGFQNLQVLDKVLAKPESVPFSLYLNLDKPLVFFALLLACPALLGSGKTGDGKAPQIQPVLLTLIFLFSLLPVAVGLGALKWEVGLPSWWWLFALNNLFLTCVAEEALFRGFVQQSLSRHLDWRMALLIASVLFGAAHFAGGLLYMVFAMLAGLGYGLVFCFTGRLWCAVLVHFLFNFVHLALFTYPALA